MLETLQENFFNLDVAWRYLPSIGSGMVVTIQLAFVIVITGLALGLALAFLRALQLKLLAFPIIIFADIFRALPPLIVMIIFYFAGPFVGVKMSGFVATWLALSLSLAAFAEEIFWAGILSVNRGQWEAARSSGLTYSQTLFNVVLPQAVRLTLPPLTNRTIAITKMTALASVVAVEEILANAATAQAYSANTTPLTMAAIAYLIIFAPLVALSRWIERRYAWKH